MNSPLDRLTNEEGEQGGNDSLNLIAQETHQQVELYRPFGEFGFIDAYLKVKAHLLLKLRSGNGQEFFACIQRDWRALGDLNKTLKAGSEGSKWRGWVERLIRRHLIWSEGVSNIYQAHGQEQSVFVDVVHSVEGPQQAISSLIWLDTVDRFESLLPNSFYYSIQGTLVGLGRECYREFCIGSGSVDESISEIVKSTTETMQSIAGNEWNLSGDGWNLVDIKRHLSCMRILLAPDGYLIPVPKVEQGGVQLVDVLFGPLILE